MEPIPVTLCPVCDHHSASVSEVPNVFENEIDCPNCGHFFVSTSVFAMLQHAENWNPRRPLMAALRARHERGYVSNLSTTNVDGLIAEFDPPKNPADAIDRLLLLVADRGDSYGAKVQLVSTTDCLLLGLRHLPEFNFIRANATHQGFIECDATGCVLTLNGWGRVSDLWREGIDPTRAFVAMAFGDDQLDEAWNEGIRLALKDAGYHAVRVDEEEHNGKICDRIISEIKKAALIVADFTLHRQNVYFEAGFALGLGRAVIWTCRADEMTKDKAHFDTRQYNHIVWGTTEELRRRLLDRILATAPIGS